MIRTLRAPDLSDDAVLRFVGGVRPCRRGGLRIEAEQLGSDAGSVTVVHNYGHGGCGVSIAFGAAEEVVRLIDERLAPDAPVAVLGAGVVGLATAIRLLECGRRVRVIAERAATETVSAVAGALWLPTGIEFGDTPERLSWFHRILNRSVDSLQALDDSYGIERLPVYEPSGAPDQPEFFDNGSIHPPVVLDALPIGADAGPGRVFETLFIHTPVFLPRLVERVRSLGGRFEMRRIRRICEIGRLREPGVVNCLAYGSRDLFDDGAVFPARGMLVLLKPQDLGYIKHDGYRYMFPRRDALVLGGCFIEGDDRPEPDGEICRRILADHRAFWGQHGSGV
ncbi:MAG: FAD-dependent oxidoreductase [Planctomycetota bacterium]